MQENVQVIPVGTDPASQVNAIRSLAMARRDAHTLMTEYGNDGQAWMNDKFGTAAARHLIDIVDFCAIVEGITDSIGQTWSLQANTGLIEYSRTRSSRVVYFTRKDDDQRNLVLDTSNPKAVTFVPGPLWVIPVLRKFKELNDKQVSDQALALYQAESDEQATKLNTLKLIAQNV
jgi:hypothetical protein